MSTRARRRWSRPPTGSSRRLAWLLALALLLPFAQAVAWAHALSHHGTPVQRADAGAPGQLDAPCAICLAAVPLQAGALPSTPPAALDPPLVHAAPQAPARVARRHTDSLAYRSRAPPLTLR